MVDRNEYIRNYMNNRRHNDPEFKRKTNQAVKSSQKRIRTEILVLLGNRCSKCGFSDIRALEIDHINGHGNEIRQKYTRWKYYKYILEEIKSGSTDYQLLCANCNAIKRIDKNENPNI